MACHRRVRPGRVATLAFAGLLVVGAVGCDGGETEQIGNLSIDLTEPGADTGGSAADAGSEAAQG